MSYEPHSFLPEQINDLIEGLQIIRDIGIDIDVYAEEDCIKCGCVSKTPEPQFKRLQELGWHKSYDGGDIWQRWLYGQ